MLPSHKQQVCVFCEGDECGCGIVVVGSWVFECLGFKVYGCVHGGVYGGVRGGG